MKSKLLKFIHDFAIVVGNKRSQAAEMVLKPGDSEGGPDNRHRGADQWLFVVSGSGQAKINGRRHPMRKGTLLLIERGERHEIKNSSRREALVTLNFYVPPAYTAAGNELPAGRAK